MKVVKVIKTKVQYVSPQVIMSSYVRFPLYYCRRNLLLLIWSNFAKPRVSLKMQKTVLSHQNPP
jgi:hypothetical protein